MSEYFSKLFRATSPKTNMRHSQRKQLPKDFAQQILDNDIILVLSEYTNDDALRNLINLYMLGVEHFKEIQDQSYKYFQIQLNKLILNPVVTQPNLPSQQKTPQSPIIKKKNLAPPKIDVNIHQEHQENQDHQIHQDLQYSKTAQIMRDTKTSTFNFNDDSITQNHNLKINKHNNNTSSVDFDHEQQQQNDIQNRVQSQQDERKENMTLDLKQQLFLFDENKEASDLIDQYKSDQLKIEKIKNEQISKQTTAFLMKLSQRNNKKKFNTQIVTNINRYNSQPTFQNQNESKSEQRPIQDQIIFEDKNESSSKILSSEKNTNKFQFDELQDT
ncbi:unnamed protein product [Paramecium sonneborni]|uniref:Uncharacterized protein n=1 Tax=Paramecium sonneborni TaxID=65129 RepID=A0A8S1P0Q5_9CILI|nr:unnamed protein product [Paramecium sonneborni]